MQFLSLLLVLGLVACSGKPGNPVASTSPVVPVAEEAKLNDSPEVARMRAAILAELEKQKGINVAKFTQAGSAQDSAAAAKEFDTLIQKIRTLPAADAATLNKLAKKDYDAARENIFQLARARAVSEIPARINPEPMAGEKRELADADGQCTNDVLVDVGTYGLKLMDTAHDMNAAAQARGKLASIQMKLLATSLLEKCDEIVDRYGDKNECEYKVPGEEPEILKMSEFKEGCESNRKSFASFL